MAEGHLPGERDLLLEISSFPWSFVSSDNVQIPLTNTLQKTLEVTASRGLVHGTLVQIFFLSGEMTIGKQRLSFITGYVWRMVIGTAQDPT